MTLGDRSNQICGCCGADGDRREVGRADSRLMPVATSDAAYLRDVRVRRELCETCGVLEARYDPEDALSRHFSREYDLDASVQNNLVISGGRVLRKKSLIDSRLDHWIESWNAPIESALEIACGRGELISRLAEDHGHWRCAGVDPSPDLKPRAAAKPGAPRLVRSFFSAELFEGEKFGAVIAHGFLNRSPTIRELKAIRSLCRDGALVSIEVLLLDTSPHCPAIWDHSYMFSKRSFMRWLEAVGFHALDMADNASSWHIIARAGEARAAADFRAEGEPERSLRLYERFESWWSDAAAGAAALADACGGPVGLFGAGMFTAGLLSRAPDLGPEFIIDDVKAGGRLFGVPICTIDEAPREALTILFTRPAYASAIAERLALADLRFKIVPGRAGAPGAERKSDAA
ncbi:MAG: hypothetical protein Tsb0010_18100 [Parvularculaceae bacterium]